MLVVSCSLFVVGCSLLVVRLDAETYLILDTQYSKISTLNSLNVYHLIYFNDEISIISAIQEKFSD